MNALQYLQENYPPFPIVEACQERLTEISAEDFIKKVDEFVVAPELPESSFVTLSSQEQYYWTTCAILCAGFHRFSPGTIVEFRVRKALDSIGIKIFDGTHEDFDCILTSNSEAAFVTNYDKQTVTKYRPISTHKFLYLIEDRYKISQLELCNLVVNISRKMEQEND